MTRLARDDLGDRDAFVLGLVREHRPGDHVADREDARHVRLEMRVDDDAPLVVERDAGFLEPEPSVIRHAADRDEHHVGFQRFRLAAGWRARPLAFSVLPLRIDRR